MQILIKRMYFLASAITLVLIFPSCSVEECGCVSNSPIVGRWSGSYVSDSLAFEILLNLNGKDSLISGSATINSVFKSTQYDFVVSVQGTFINRGLNLIFVGNENIVSYNGMFQDNKNSIFGFIVAFGKEFPLNLYRSK